MRLSSIPAGLALACCASLSSFSLQASAAPTLPPLAQKIEEVGVKICMNTGDCIYATNSVSGTLGLPDDTNVPVTMAFELFLEKGGSLRGISFQVRFPAHREGSNEVPAQDAIFTDYDGDGEADALMVIALAEHQRSADGVLLQDGPPIMCWAKNGPPPCAAFVNEGIVEHLLADYRTAVASVMHGPPVTSTRGA